MITPQEDIFVEKLNVRPSNDINEKKDWQKPVLVTLEFSETRQTKKEGGFDGAEQPGNIKFS